MNLRYLNYLIFILLLNSACSNRNKIETILSNDEFLNEILIKKDQYEISIIYTQIDRDSLNSPSFKTYSFNYDTSRYFYPASTVKFPAAVLSLEKLNRLNIKDLNIETTLLTDSAFNGQSAVRFDSTSQNNMPSISHYIKKIFQVSDNDAFNRLYEFLGQDYFNNTLTEKGYNGTNIIHRLSIALSKEENRMTNPIRFIHRDSVVYSQGQVAAFNTYDREKIVKGKAFISKGVKIEEPMNFTYKNRFPLHEQHLMLQEIMFPYTSKRKPFTLSEKDYSFLYQWMQILPGESKYPDYSDKPENYCKFLMFADGEKDLPDNIRIFNKIGLAYGYTIDNAYIIDTKNKVEFLLSAVIHTNANQTFNDGIYEYDSIAFPFMERVGNAIYKYELERERKNKPDFSRFL